MIQRPGSDSGAGLINSLESLATNSVFNSYIFPRVFR